MKQIFSSILLLCLLQTPAFATYQANTFAADQTMSPDEAKQFVKTAVSYALENMSPDMD